MKNRGPNWGPVREGREVERRSVKCKESRHFCGNPNFGSALGEKGRRVLGMAVVWKDDDGFSTGDIFQGGRTNYLNNDA